MYIAFLTKKKKKVDLRVPPSGPDWELQVYMDLLMFVVKFRLSSSGTNSIAVCRNQKEEDILPV